MKDKEKEKLNNILCQNIKSLERRIQKFDKVTKVKDLAIIKLSDAINEHCSETIGNDVPFQCENVSVGSQTEEEDSKETLQDTAKAFLMQNKYLNKEVLELNQLRQQAMEKEHKHFLEASNWEAKFYQVQSKYLHLLNELHNPEIMASEKRLNMINHLLQDIIDKTEKTSNFIKNTEIDRFGFLCQENESLLDKAERLQRFAQENLEEADLTADEIETQWNDVVRALEGSSNLVVNKEMKGLIRKGIPNKLRSNVWRAVIINRICGSIDINGYYQVLLSNYKPGFTVTTAAKQIELDLLRTFPDNIHYQNAESEGI